MANFVIEPNPPNRKTGAPIFSHDTAHIPCDTCETRLTHWRPCGQERWQRCQGQTGLVYRLLPDGTYLAARCWTCSGGSGAMPDGDLPVPGFDTRGSWGPIGMTEGGTLLHAATASASIQSPAALAFRRWLQLAKLHTRREMDRRKLARTAGEATGQALSPPATAEPPQATKEAP